MQPSPAEPAVGQSLALADRADLSVTAASGKTQPVETEARLRLLRGCLHRENSRPLVEEGHDEGYVLASPAFRSVHRDVVEAAGRGKDVVLIGETGTGKDDLARCYHTHGARAAGPYVVLHCGNLVGDIGYVDLFGAMPGAAPGISAKVGAVEDANHGTLFLDEVAELSPRYQAALLRFLNRTRDQQGKPRRGEFFRLGDTNRSRPRYASEVNIVAATNVDLDDPDIRRAHQFRSDLWHRLAEDVVRVPPLSSRREDIQAYLALHPRDQPVKLLDALTPGALTLLLHHSWPGNFRELSSFAGSPRLPARLSPGGVDEDTCREALRLAGNRGAMPASPLPSAAVFSASIGSPDFAEVNAVAIRAFAEDHGAAPLTIGQLDDYFRLYLKPVLVAHASGLQGIQALSKDINYSELARRLHFKDGTTVRLQLIRYLERFRR